MISSTLEAKAGDPFTSLKTASRILTLHIEDDRGIGWPATPWVLQGAVKLMLGALGSDSESAGTSREGVPAHTQQS